MKRNKAGNESNAERSFSFWKNNNKNEQFELSSEQLTTRFLEWKTSQLADNSRGIGWWNYYYGERLIQCFISDKELFKGLQSVVEEAEFYAVYGVLKPLMKIDSPPR